MWMLNWPTAWKPEPIVPKLQVAVWPLGLQGLPALKLSPEASVIVKIVFVDESGPALSTVALTTMSLPGVCEPTGPLRLSLRSAAGGGGGGGVWISKVLVLLAVLGSLVSLVKLEVIV